MANAKDIIKEELLKQMDEDSAESPDADKNPTRRIIEINRTRVRRLKWIAATSWLITILYFLAMHALKDIVLRGREAFLTRDEFELIGYSDMGLKVLALIAVLLTYLAYCKSKTLTILQIYAKLAAIEEQLKTIARDKSPAQDIDGSAQVR